MIDSVQDYPEWHNKPLHLKIEEISNPHRVLEYYFESYNLHEARSIVEEWMVEVISSHRSNCEKNRNNTIHFCKHLLTLIEAAWIINGKAHYLVDIDKNEPSKTDEIMGKGKNLIEYASEDPIYVIKEVCGAIGIEEFYYKLLQWLNIALINDEALYTRDEARNYLMTFHNELTVLFKSLFAFNDWLKKTAISESLQSDNERKSKANNTVDIETYDHNSVKLLSIDFFKRFPITYVRREIAEWFFAAIIYDGNCPVNLTKLQIYVTWEWASCITEAAWNLSLLQTKKDFFT